MLTFPYQAYAVNPAAGLTDGMLYVPEVPLRVIGLSGDITIRALLDTGADGTILPWDVAAIVGVPLDEQQATTVAGITGHQMQVFPGFIDLELTDGDEGYRWSVTVDFATKEHELESLGALGQSGCLELFVATFDGGAHQVQLEPAASFPGRVTRGAK